MQSSRKEVGGIPMHREKTIRGDSEKAAIYKPGREASEDSKSSNTSILDFQPPEQRK